MKHIFVDTSAWAAIADAGDSNHEIAQMYKEEIAKSCNLLVTNYIFDELHTLMLMNLGYQDTVDFKHDIDTLIETGIVEVVWVTEAIAEDAWMVFEKFNVDKEWSFTDCVSYVVIKQHKITEVFTFDRHFTQMGFVKQP
jgi:predicted nucleic acid-binding protein